MPQEIKAQGARQPETKVPAPPRYVDPFTAMRAEMDRVFDSFLGPGPLRFPAFARDPGRDLVTPSIDVRETGNELVVEAELPGLDEKDVTVTLREGVLTLKGEKKSEREEKTDDYHVTERSFGSFQRALRVGDGVDAERVKASFDKGVLKVTLPKRPEVAKAERRIPIGKG